MVVTGLDPVKINVFLIFYYDFCGYNLECFENGEKSVFNSTHTLVKGIASLDDRIGTTWHLSYPLSAKSTTAFNDLEPSAMLNEMKKL